ncbi:MAG: PSD1 and planctomycete cytochrome C domain-containing protein [Planctomycetota bacterium]|nr:PSD1 and planctomycete cytochrome C domain-containing protein [Planctomycetota bacterium]
MVLNFLSLILLAAVVDASAVAHATEPSRGEKLFALKVKSLFASKCMACHGDDPDKIGGGFDMRSREAMLKGGESFTDEVLVPGKGEKSFLYIATTRSEEGFEMPPKEAERLTEEQTWWIRDWINAGAPWPDETRVADIQNKYAEGLIVKTSGGLGDDWTNRRYKPEHLWAYQPLKIEDVPDSTHPVDWFIDRRLKGISLAPAPVAQPRELARRLSFGITGLPPTPEDASHFEAAAKNDASAAVVDYARKLMASPHYGEHFGRQWLDVARYADSAGFANDYSRPNAWRYRDYVVRAFNTDKPYDNFVREQIAGDELLKDAGGEQKGEALHSSVNTHPSELMVATGFLRMGPWEQTGMSVFRITRQQWLDDVTDSVGQAFLGHPLQCAKCHDHKFDPIPTRDYYSMMAVFSTTQFVERDAPFTKDENLSGFKSATEWTRAKIEAYQKERNELNSRVNKNRKDETESAKVGDNGLDPGDEASLARMARNISRHTWEYDKTRPIAFSVHTGHTIQRANVGSRIDMPDNPWDKGFLEEDTILTGGNAYARGDAVKPGPISAAGNLGAMPTASFPDGRGKRRLALAEWIVNQRNPLTARVMANRVWAWHFGKGLAGNPNNFGATGKLPTHPALLDYLANWFMEHDWSVKQLNELILTSATYRRSSRHPNLETLDEKDPTRDFYATCLPRRLTAEELRDSMLAVSGELNRQRGGIPCRPDINFEVAMQPRQIMGGTASVYEPDPLPEQRNRRSVYAEKIRGLRDPFLEAFNQPGPDKSCELRETSTVAPQALTLFNAEEVQDRSIALAARLTTIEGDNATLLQRAFELALGRVPTDDELQACLAHWTQATKEETSKHYDQKKFSSRVKRTVMAEKTGEPYDFFEVMPAYENYVPDLQPAHVDARTRGLAHVCLVIFNLNEFAYID